MIIDKQQEIIEAIYQEDSIGEIYFGNDLVFIKHKEEDQVFEPDKLYVKGKFTDDSTESDWYVSDYNNFGMKKSIADQVNPVTKEFYVVLENFIPFSLFENNSKLERIDLFFIPTGATKFGYCFSRCSKLTKINLSKCNTQNITELKGVFSYIYDTDNLDLHYFNTQKVTETTEMFYNSYFKSLNLANWNTTSLKKTSNMFYSCLHLQTLDLSGWDFKNIENLSGMFCNCGSLVNLNLGNFDLQNATDIRILFEYCYALTNVSGTVKNIKENLLFSESRNLSNESAMLFINGLAEVDTNKTITFHRNTFNTLTEDQKQIAIEKGWTIASAS